MATETYCGVAGRVIRVGARVSVSQARRNPFPATTDQENIREPELRVHVLGGIGATTLRRLIADEGFPEPIRLSDRILVWSLPLVRAWIAARPVGGGDVMTIRTLDKVTIGGAI